MPGGWRTIAELIGMGAVVASLLLVVFELRQTQIAISAAAHSERTMRNLEILRFAVEFDSREIRTKLQRGEELSPHEQQILDNLLQMQMRHFEDLQYQHEIGAIPDETWQANLAGLHWAIQREQTEQYWERLKPFYRASFGSLVESLRSENR